MRTFTTRGRKLHLPECTAELTPAQYGYFCFLACELERGDISLTAMRQRWLSYLMGLGNADYTILRAQHVAEIEAQADIIDGFFTPAGNGANPTPDFSTPCNLLPEYGGYNGPGDWLDGITFGQFTECMTALSCISGGDDDAELYARVARCLYRIPDGDTVPPLLLFHAPRLFLAVWRRLQEEPVEVNGSLIDFRILFRRSGAGRPDDKTGWTGITFELASTGVFGRLPDVEASDLWAVLLYLYKCKFEYINEQRANQAK